MYGRIVLIVCRAKLNLAARFFWLATPRVTSSFNRYGRGHNQLLSRRERSSLGDKYSVCQCVSATTSLSKRTYFHEVSCEDYTIRVYDVTSDFF